MERIHTRNERLCYRQKSTATLLPFILPPSHNDREMTERRGRNKTQIAKAAEKRLAYKINGKRKEKPNIETKNQADHKSGKPTVLNLQFEQTLNKEASNKEIFKAIFIFSRQTNKDANKSTHQCTCQKRSKSIEF